MGISFDPKKLLKSTNLNPKEKISAAINKKSSSLNSKLSATVSSKLSAAGQSLKSATAFAAAKTDALLSSSPEAFSSMAALGGGNPAISRISRKDIVNSRLGKGIISDPQKIIPQSKESGSYSDTKTYPTDLGDMEYRMTLEFMEYKRPSLSEAPVTEIRFAISLPIPNTLMESYGVGYSEGKYGSTLGNVINEIDRIQAAGSTTGDMDNATTLGLARGALQPAAAGIIGGVGGAIGIDGEGVSGVIDQQLGSIANPHMSMFFTGVSMREHQFFWPFAPRNSNDSKAIKEIYYRIKRSALPTFTPNASHTTLEYPMMVKVRIFTKGGKELYPFKMCVIPSCNLNYAASGTPAFHADGRPGLAQLSLTLKEIEYFTSDDIRDFEGDDYAGFDADFAQNQVGLDNLEGFFNNGLSATSRLSQSVSQLPGLSNLFGGGN